MNSKLSIFILSIISILSLSVPVHALEENFQYYIGNDISSNWNTNTTSVGSITIATLDGIYSRTIFLSSTSLTVSGTAQITNKYPTYSNYWAFNVRSLTHFNGATFFVHFFDSSGILVSSNDLSSKTSGFWELSISGTNVYLRIDGVDQGIVGTSTGIPSYIQFKVSNLNNQGYNIYIDDITTSGYISGIGTESTSHTLTESNLVPTNISFTLNTFPWATYTTDNYTQVIEKYTGSTPIVITNQSVKNSGDSSVFVGFNNYNRKTQITSNDTNYGLYFSYLKKNGAIVAQDYFFLVPPGAANTITAADTSAVIGQSEAITYSLGSPDFIGSSYSVNVYSASALVTSIPVISATGTVNWDTTGNSNGLYFITLSQVTSGIQTDLAYTTITLVSTLLIKGIVYDAQNATTISGVNLNFSQNAIWYNTTSDASGNYNLSGLLVGLNTTIRASKTGWTHDNFSFTPLAAQVYTINLYMINNSLVCGGTTSTCINGMVESIPYHQAIVGATVHLGNGTYLASTTSSAITGFYMFQNLADDNLTYVVNSTKSGFMNSVDYNIVTLNGTDVQQIILMSEIYTLSIVAQDSTNANTILDFIATFNGITYNTSIGSVTIPNLIYGSYSTIVSSSGYLSKSQTILVDSTKTVTFILVPITPPIQSTTFKTLPHNVRFQIQDYTGKAHVGIPVTVQGWSTTVGTWTTLGQLIGLDFSTTPINNESMTGTTGIDGSTTFMMMDTVYYSVNFDGGAAYNITWYLYPKEDFYLLMIPLSSPNSGCSQNTTYNLTQTTINATYTALGLTYSDPSGHTTLINFFVQNNQSVYLYTNSSASSSLTDSFAVNSSVTGTTYFWGFNSTNGCALAQTQVITFRGSGKLIDLHISEGYYQWISIILIVFMASLFSIKKIKFGAVITPLTAGVLYTFGWFTINPILLSIAIVIGIMIYLRASESKVIY